MKRETAQRHSLKIIAIFFAVSLWFYVLNSEPLQIEKKLTINYILPKGYAISSLSEKEVTLKLKGSKAFIQNVFSNKEKINVDLNPYFVSSGKTFKVDILPKETTIDLDRMVKLEMPIRVQYIGDVPRDRKLKEVAIDPQSITISGPVEILKTMSRLETAPVNLALFNKDEGSTTVSLADLDPRLTYDEEAKVKLKYKTQVLNIKRTPKKEL